jgi:hypothetical protein
MRGVAVLDFPWSDGSYPWRGDGQSNPSLRLPNRERRELAPACSPRMPGQQGSPGWEGQKGRPEESERPKLSRKTDEGRKEERSEEDKKVEPMDADAIPGSESRSSQFIILGAGDRGWVRAGTLPSYPKGIPDDSVAAGGCPASPSLLRGWCEGQLTLVVAGVEGLVALLARLPCGWQG